MFGLYLKEQRYILIFEIRQDRLKSADILYYVLNNHLGFFFQSPQKLQSTFEFKTFSNDSDVSAILLSRNRNFFT